MNQRRLSKRTQSTVGKQYARESINTLIINTFPSHAPFNFAPCIFFCFSIDNIFTVLVLSRVRDQFIRMVLHHPSLPSMFIHFKYLDKLHPTLEYFFGGKCKIYTQKRRINNKKQIDRIRQCGCSLILPFFSVCCSIEQIRTWRTVTRKRVNWKCLILRPIQKQFECSN